MGSCKIHFKELITPAKCCHEEQTDSRPNMARCISQLLLHNKPPPTTQWLKAISIYYCPQSVDQVGGSISLDWIHSCRHVLGHLEGELWISSAKLSHALGFGLSLSDMISPSSRLTHACSHGVLAGFQERKTSVQGLLATGSEQALCHFCHILLARASHKADPEIKGGDINSNPLWEEL